jgi:hypothetical protein
MTKEQKATKIVQAGIDGGWKPDIEGFKSFTKSVAGKTFVIIQDDINRDLIRFYYKSSLFAPIKPNKIHFYKTINDLILNKPFMRSVYGEGYVCEWCDSEDKLKNKCLADLKVEQNKLNECAHLKDGKDKTKCPCYIIAHEYEGQPAYRYHAHKALDIIYEGGDVIKYLYQSMEG